MGQQKRAVFNRDDVQAFVGSVFEDVHAKRVLSIANATTGVLTSASLAVGAIGQGMAHATLSCGTTAAYGYDSGENGIGRLAQITDASGRSEFAYDRHGRVTRRTQTAMVNGVTRVLTTGYR